MLWSPLYPDVTDTDDCYITSLEWQAYFKLMKYNTLSSTWLTGELLNTIYNDIKTQVDRVIDGCTEIGLVVDESTDIIGDRITTLEVIVKGNSYH